MTTHAENVEVMQTGIEKWLDYARPLIAAAQTHSWAGGVASEFFNILKRAAVVRQTEALEEMLRMVDSGHGAFAVTFLRPAYEEVIWIEYLNKHVTEAKELITLLGSYEISESIKAQNDFAGRRGMEIIGFSKLMVEREMERSKKVTAQIRAVGKRLGWEMGRGPPLPSMAYLSRKVGRHRDYKFLYLATSRFVHFSPSELFRRVWGQPGQVTVGSSTFSVFWQNFAMYWGFRLYVDLLIACHDVFQDVNPDRTKYEEAVGLLNQVAQVPIVTVDELEWSSKT